MEDGTRRTPAQPHYREMDFPTNISNFHSVSQSPTAALFVLFLSCLPYLPTYLTLLTYLLTQFSRRDTKKAVLIFYFISSSLPLAQLIPLEKVE